MRLWKGKPRLDEALERARTYKQARLPLYAGGISISIWTLSRSGLTLSPLYLGGTPSSFLVRRLLQCASSPSSCFMPRLSDCSTSLTTRSMWLRTQPIVMQQPRVLDGDDKSAYIRLGGGTRRCGANSRT